MLFGLTFDCCKWGSDLRSKLYGSRVRTDSPILAWPTSVASLAYRISHDTRVPVIDFEIEVSFWLMATS
jgi:hypothetical protein